VCTDSVIEPSKGQTVSGTTLLFLSRKPESIEANLEQLPFNSLDRDSLELLVRRLIQFVLQLKQLAQFIDTGLV
jgi:hypothetical protein